MYCLNLNLVQIFTGVLIQQDITINSTEFYYPVIERTRNRISVSLFQPKFQRRLISLLFSAD